MPDRVRMLAVALALVGMGCALAPKNQIRDEPFDLRFDNSAYLEDDPQRLSLYRKLREFQRVPDGEREALLFGLIDSPIDPVRVMERWREIQLSAEEIARRRYGAIPAEPGPCGIAEAADDGGRWVFLRGECRGGLAHGKPVDRTSAGGCLGRVAGLASRNTHSHVL